MKRALNVLLAGVAVGVLAHARPASACGAQQKTTTSKAEEKVPPQKLSTSEPQQGAKSAKAKPTAQQDPSAQAKAEAATRAQPR